jgi:hypothetical protein
LIRTLKNVRHAVGSKTFAAAVAIGAVLAYGGAASATGDAVSDGFTSLTTTLLGYLGDAVVMVLALAGLAIGIRFLIRWAKRAASV